MSGDAVETRAILLLIVKRIRRRRVVGRLVGLQGVCRIAVGRTFVDL